MPFDDPSARPAEIEVPNQREIAILDEMTRLLSRPNGWCQGDFVRSESFTQEPAYCLVGALGMAAEGDPQAYRYPARRYHCGDRVLTALERRLSKRSRMGLWSWNDHRSRQQAHVLNLLRLTRADFE